MVSAVNTASFALPDLANGSLAQGGMFAVFGSNIGPAVLVQADMFPLPTELGGVSVAVSVGGTTVDCIMVFALSTQLAAVLPSETPVGDGTLTVTYNGQTSPPIAVSVVGHSFGVFAINTSGSGPGVLTNAVNPLSVNTVFNTAASGELWDIWGTGLGAVEGDEAAAPLPGDLPYDVKVFVGDIEAEVVYRGRSGCCVGLDQIRFVVPPGITGCYIPVTVVVEGVSSNFTTMAISESGGACSDDATGIDSETLSEAHEKGSLSVGFIFGSRVRTDSSLPSQARFQTGDLSESEDEFSAFFEEFTIREAEGTSINIQGCYVYQFADDDGQEPPDPIEARPLRVGSAMTLNPGGELIQAEPDLSFSKSFSESPFYEDNTTYTADWPGGAEVGPGSAFFETGTPLTWTNPTATIRRDEPFEVRWQGGVGDQVAISGISFLDMDGEGEGSGAAFLCTVDRAPGFYRIPARILGGLPATVSIQGAPSGSFSVASRMYAPCSADGLDLCFSGFSSADAYSGVAYE